MEQVTTVYTVHTKFMCPIQSVTCFRVQSSRWGGGGVVVGGDGELMRFFFLAGLAVHSRLRLHLQCMHENADLFPKNTVADCFIIHLWERAFLFKFRRINC